jgi:hypothetical protein
MNMHVACSKAHVDVARRPGDVTLLSWSKTRHLASTKSEKNDESTTSGPTSSLEINYLAPAASVGQQHIEK